jgi:tetratricopeptide (TPR) repeat protein
MATHESLSAALQMHQAGQLTVAAQLYQQLLLREPDNPDALHLHGVLCHQQGVHARAVEQIGKAVVLRPNAAALHANLAEAYRGLGQFERAAGCCRTALRLWPNFPEARCNLGLALQGGNGDISILFGTTCAHDWDAANLSLSSLFSVCEYVWHESSCIRISEVYQTPKLPLLQSCIPEIRCKQNRAPCRTLTLYRAGNIFAA